MSYKPPGNAYFNTRNLQLVQSEPPSRLCHPSPRGISADLDIHLSVSLAILSLCFPQHKPPHTVCAYSQALYHLRLPRLAVEIPLSYCLWHGRQSIAFHFDTPEDKAAPPPLATTGQGWQI